MGRKWWKRKIFTNPVGAVIETVKAVARNPLKEVFKVTKATADFLVDDIIDPIVKLADDVVQAALSDPIGTIAKIYAISTGQFYLLPYIAAASTAINGGDIGDIVKAAAISYVAGEVATGVGSYAVTAGTAAEYGVSVGSSQASQLALQEAGMGSVVSITNSIAASSIGNAAAAVVVGQDPMKAFVSGGISAGVPAALGKIDGFVELQRTNPAVANVITKAVTTELQGGDVSAATLNAVIISSEIAAKAINTFDPQKKMTDAERAVATNLIINTTTAAVKGGDINAAINATLVSSAVNSLGKIVTSEFKTKVAAATKNYESASEIAEKMTASDARQSELIADYNNIAAQFDIRSDEQARLQKVDADNRAKYDAMVKSGATNEQLNTQAALINKSTDDLKTYASDFSKYVDENKPTLNTLKTEIDTLAKTETTLQSDLTKTLENQLTLTKPISAVTDIATDVLNESFTKAIDPNFNAKEYAEINGLDVGANAYTDFMEKGRDAGVPTNLQAASAEINSERTQLITKVLASQGLTLDNADPEDVSKLIDSVESKYGNNLTMLRGASIQDVISGNTRTIESIANEPWRVDISGSAYGDWKKPDEKTFKVPEGFKLATTEEFESKQADKFLADDGQAVWLVPDGTAERPVWDDEAGVYTLKTITITASKPSTADVYSVAAINDPDNASIFTAIAATAATGFGQQIETWSNAINLQFGGDMKNTTTKLGKTLQEWGAANTPSKVVEQMKAVDAGMKAATSKGSIWEQTVAVAKLAKQNPSAFLAYVGSEVAQEALPVGAGLVAAGVAAYLGAPVAIGVASATAIATIIDGIEVFGSAGKEVYDARIKAGDTEDEARSKASLAGYKASLVTAPANALANAAVFAPYLKTLGVVANTSLQGAKGVTASAAGEYIETYSQSLITQAAINPDAPLNFSDAHVKSVFASMIGAGTTGVVLSPSIVNGSLAIGFDDAGNKVTYADLQNGSANVNLSKIDTNIVVGTNEDGGDVTLGDLITSDAATNSGAEITKLTGEVAVPDQINVLTDPYFTDESEARAAFKAVGYTPTQDEVNEYIGRKKEEATLARLESFYDPLATTNIEAKQIAEKLGYAGVTQAEAESLAGQFGEEEANRIISEYISQHSVTPDQAKNLLIAAGIPNPTPEQIGMFAISGETVDSSKVKTELETYADPFAVNKDEVRAAFKELGLETPTDKDIDALVGSYSESELSGKTLAALDTAIRNSEFKSLSDRLGTQRRDPNQSDLDKLQGMLAGTVPVDTTYDVDKDGKITSSDLDFLTTVVKTPNINEPYKPVTGSPWAPTGLYAELEKANEDREKDRLRLEEQRTKDLDEQAKREKQAKVQAAGSATARALQQFAGTAPTLLTQATQEVSTPIYGQAIKEFDFGAPLDYSFFEPSKEKQDSQTGQQTTKIATGGYLDDLLAENMTVDDLLKLLR